MARLADMAITVTDIVGGVASFGVKALPVAEFIASFIPGAAPAVAAVRIAMPYIVKVAAAAPVVKDAIEKGRPIFDAIQDHGPSLLPDLKKIYAIAVNHDPAKPETVLAASEVSDKQAMAFAGPVLFGRRWTEEEERQWFDRADDGVDR